MFYPILRFFVKCTLQVYIKKIHLLGFENLPENKPVIFACNHPNSFLDAQMAGVVLPLKFKVHFLVRSDVFRKKWSNWLLRAMYQIPVYRRQEGMKNMRRNKETSLEVTEVLRKKQSVLIFSEGISLQNRRLEPLKKGTARMALEAAERGIEGIRIVPVGFNYAMPTAFRTEVSMNIGKPIPVDNFIEQYKTSQAVAANDLTATIEEALRNQVIHIEEESNEPLYEANVKKIHDAFPISFFPHVVKGSEKFNSEKQVEAALNKGTAVPESTTLSHSGKGSKVVAALVLLTTLPVFIGGGLLAIFPGLLAEKMTMKKVRLPEFIASVRMIIGMVFYLVQLLILTIVLCFFWGWKGLLLLIAAPYIGYWSFVWKDAFLHYFYSD